MKKLLTFALALLAVFTLSVSAGAVTTTFLGQIHIKGNDPVIDYDYSAALMIEEEDDSVAIYAKEYYGIPQGYSNAYIQMTENDKANCKLDVSYPQKKYSLWTITSTTPSGDYLDEIQAYILKKAPSRKNQAVTAFFLTAASSVDQSDVTLLSCDENGFVEIEGNLRGVGQFPAALIDADGRCVGLITDIDANNNVTAFVWDWNDSAPINWLLIGLIAAGALLLAGVVVLIVLLTRRNKDKGAQPAPVYNNPVYTPDQQYQPYPDGQYPPPQPYQPEPVPVAPAAPTAYILKATSGVMTGRSYILRNGDPTTMTVGRTKMSVISYPDDAKEISHRHAEFRISNGQLTVRDVGSTNGTYIRSAGSSLTPRKIAVNEEVFLGKGDIVYFANSKNGFLIDTQ